MQVNPQEIADCAKKITAELGKLESPLQAAVLADVTALWLAGHRARMPIDTFHLRMQLWVAFEQSVRRLLPVKDQIVREHMAELRRNPR